MEKVEHVKVDPDDDKQVGAPLQGLLSEVMVKKGDVVKKNQPLFIIEAMKMETTVAAPAEGSIEKIHLDDGTMVDANDLVVSLE